MKVIRFKIKEKIKPRAGVKQTRKHKNRKAYSRKKKHKDEARWNKGNN